MEIVVSQQMHDDGYVNVINVDYSSVVIEQMNKKYAASHPELKCKLSKSVKHANSDF